MGDRTTKARCSEVKVTETQFADDAALYKPSQHNTFIIGIIIIRNCLTES